MNENAIDVTSEKHPLAPVDKLILHLECVHCLGHLRCVKHEEKFWTLLKV